MRPVQIFWGAVVAAVALLLGTLSRGWPGQDPPVAGACARLSIGTLLGAVVGWFYSRGLPPGLAGEVLLLGLGLGATVGLVWGLAWFATGSKTH